MPSSLRLSSLHLSRLSFISQPTLIVTTHTKITNQMEDYFHTLFTDVLTSIQNILLLKFRRNVLSIRNSFVKPLNALADSSATHCVLLTMSIEASSR